VSAEVVFSRIASMSAGTLWALVVLVLVLIVGVRLIYGLYLKKGRAGDSFRIKVLGFFEFETSSRADTEPGEESPGSAPPD
jgi:hypothetical protein